MSRNALAVRTALSALVASASLVASCSSDSSADGSSSGGSPSAAQSGPIMQLSFATADDALTALSIAASEDDGAYLREIFGPEVVELSSGDPERDKSERARFGAAMREFHELRPIESDAAAKSATGYHVIVGPQRIEFPVPLVQLPSSGRWMFDTIAGVEAMIDLRVGGNELRTIAAMRELPSLQREYHAVDRDGDGINEYAQRLRSSPGARDGLYWETAPDEPQSPLGPYAANVAEVHEEGLGYNGYEYRVLTSFVSGAPAKTQSYLKGRDLTAGYAILAWPAIYDRTGVMTFMVGPDGVVYEKNLGAATRDAAAKIEAYDPTGWAQTAD